MTAPITNTPVYNWRLAQLGEDPDGEEGWRELAEDIEGTMVSTAMSSWTPSITATGSVPFSNPNGTHTGRYRSLAGVYCEVIGHIAFGSGIQGGRGTLKVAMPVAGRADMPEQWFPARLQLPVLGRWVGYMVVRAGESVAELWIPTTQTSNRVWAWQNADSTGAAGTGYPGISGQFGVQSGGQLSFGGRYRI